MQEYKITEADFNEDGDVRLTFSGLKIINMETVRIIETAINKEKLWQPIETAPKDGTHILLFYPELFGEPDTQTVGHWTLYAGGTWQGQFGFKSDTPELPTHWMPLPPPPKEV